MGKDNSIGEMIHDARKQRNVRGKQLCRGLCSEAALSNYENGERIPDSLLFYTLIGRLGKGIDRFCIMISDEDGEYYRWRKETQDAVWKEDWVKLEQLLKTYHDMYVVENRIQEQYSLYLSYVVLIRRYKKYDEAFRTIERALRCTVPHPLQWDSATELLCADEIHVFLLYLMALMQGNMIEGRDAYCLFQKLEDYVVTWVDDTFEKSKIIPRLVCIKIHLFGAKLSTEERILCEKMALEILKKSSEIYDMPEILRLLLLDLEEINSKEYSQYLKQREALVYYLKKYGYGDVFYPEKWYGVRYQYYLVKEYLLFGRERVGLTQEKLSEDICAVETYSRIENGKVHPSTKKFSQLLEKLNLRMGYYQSQIITDNLEDLELMTRQRCAYCSEEFQEEQELLNELRKRLDMNLTENRQYIDFLQAITDFDFERIDEEEQVRRFEEILKYSWETNKNFFTKTEKDIIYCIALFYRKRDSQKSLQLINEVLSSENRLEEPSWYANGALKRLLAGLYADREEFEKSNQLTEECIREMISYQDGMMLSPCVNILGWNAERCHSRDYEQLYQDAIYLSDLFDNKMVHQKQLEYYEKHVQSGMVWY